MSQAITNAAKAEVGLDRRIMQSYPLIYQSSAPLNESNAQISRGAEKNNITYLLFIQFDGFDFLKVYIATIYKKKSLSQFF